ncbi:hypothetical protein ACQVBX_17915 [Dyella sp. KULCS107]|uniref:hypothetical protein n=1 Tax=Dyella sp. KULCS107 TaxID=3422216 RepID=UPI003D6EA0E7
MRIFGDHVSAYAVADIGLQGLIGLATFAICWKISHGNWIASLSLAAAVTLSRFATYLATQVIGPVEGVPLLLTLCAIYALLAMERSQKPSLAVALSAVAASLLATFAHERFIVVPVWLAIALYFITSAAVIPRVRKWTLILVSAFVPVLYIAYKQVVLGTTFLIGTGGTHLAFAPFRTVENGLQALYSLFGFNSGPDYLIGTPVVAGSEMSSLAFLFTSLWVFIFVAGVYYATRKEPASDGRDPKYKTMWAILILLLAGFLIAPALLTIRLEQRWIFASFVLGMLIPAWAVGNAQPLGRILLSAAVALLSLTSIMLDGDIMKSYGNVFFVSSANFAEAAKRDVADASSRQEGPVAFLANSSHCDWTLLNGEFFRLYGGTSRPVYCFDSLDSAATAKLPRSTRLYASTPTELVDVTDELRRLNQLNQRDVIVDFIKRFKEGSLNDTRDVETPSRRGAFLMPWNTVTGERETLTVLSGFSYKYDQLSVPSGGALVFDIGMVYPSPQSARAIITVAYADHSEVIFKRDLRPPTRGASLRFAPVSLSLEKFSGRVVSVSFSVESPGGNSSGHWVAFAGPRLIADRDHSQ